jgi:hypothetical protein
LANAARILRRYRRNASLRFTPPQKSPPRNGKPAEPGFSENPARHPERTPARRARPMLHRS